MKVTILKTKGDWTEILDSARHTVSKKELNKEPSSQWKRRILLAEHSPIRAIWIVAKWEGLKSWISVHFVRHWLGIVHYVTTQRDDRTGHDRNISPQDAPVNHKFEVNQQAIINISRRRLCFQAHKETMRAWNQFLRSIKKDHPELYFVSVRECVYRNGLCPEMNTCGYNKTKAFEIELQRYISGFENQINEKTRLDYVTMEMDRIL